jgi:hypothetical protein
MSTSLQSELEPLLARLWQLADEMFYNDAVPDPTNEGYVKQAQEALKVFNDTELTSIMSRFRGYYSLDGHDLEPLSDQFAGQSERWESPYGSSVYCGVARAADDVDDVAKLVHYEEWKGPATVDTEKWQGQAATAFYKNFLEPFKRTAVAHGVCAREMAIGARALADGVEYVKACVVWICKDAIRLLGGGGDPGALPGEEHEGGKHHAAMTAILADTVALFLALTGPEGAALDAGLAAVGVTGGLIAESKAPSDEQPIGISGGVYGATSILHNTWDALRRLDMNIAEFDERIARGLEADLGSSGPLSNAFARIPDPNLDPSAFDHLNYKGLDNSDDAVVVQVVRLYYAGYRTMPAAALEYDKAAKVCAGAHIEGVQEQFPRSVGKFNEVAHTFEGLLGAVRGDLSRSGQALVEAASNYHEADAYEAAMIRQYQAEIPPPGSFAGADHYTPPPWLTP